jgi:hypothetical protein
MPKHTALSDDRIPMELRRRAADAALDLVNAEVKFHIDVVLRDWPRDPTDTEKDEMAIGTAAWHAAREAHKQAWVALASHVRNLNTASHT